MKQIILRIQEQAVGRLMDEFVGKIERLAESNGTVPAKDFILAQSDPFDWKVKAESGQLLVLWRGELVARLAVPDRFKLNIDEIAETYTDTINRVVHAERTGVESQPTSVFSAAHTFSFWWNTGQFDELGPGKGKFVYESSDAGDLYIEAEQAEKVVKQQLTAVGFADLAEILRVITYTKEEIAEYSMSDSEDWVGQYVKDSVDSDQGLTVLLAIDAHEGIKDMADTIAHECGHALWELLDESSRAEWGNDEETFADNLMWLCSGETHYMEREAQWRKITSVQESSDAGDTKRVGVVAVFRKRNGKLQVLLGKRQYDPAKGQWALPGGHCKQGESIEDGARREIKEETGLDIDQVKFFRKRDGDEGETVSLFTTLYTGKDQAEADDETMGVKWMDVDSLPEGLAFDNNTLIPETAKAVEVNETSAKDFILRQPYRPKYLVQALHNGQWFSVDYGWTSYKAKAKRFDDEDEAKTFFQGSFKFVKIIPEFKPIESVGTLIPEMAKALELKEAVTVGSAIRGQLRRVGRVLAGTSPGAFEKQLQVKADEIAQMVKFFHYQQAVTHWQQVGAPIDRPHIILAIAKTALFNSPQANASYEETVSELGLPSKWFSGRKLKSTVTHKFLTMISTAVARRFNPQVHFTESFNAKKFILRQSAVSPAQLDTEQWLIDRGFTGRKKPRGSGVVAYHYTFRNSQLTLTRTLDSIGGMVDPIWAIDAFETAPQHRFHASVRQSKLKAFIDQFQQNWHGQPMGFIDSLQNAAQRFNINDVVVEAHNEPDEVRLTNVHNKLYKKASDLIRTENPCAISGGKCIGIGKEQAPWGPLEPGTLCCKYCGKHHPDKGCQAEDPLVCKSWLCPTAAQQHPELNKKLNQVFKRGEKTGLIVPGRRMTKPEAIKQAMSWRERMRSRYGESAEEIAAGMLEI